MSLNTDFAAKLTTIDRGHTRICPGCNSRFGCKPDLSGKERSVEIERCAECKHKRVEELRMRAGPKLYRH